MSERALARALREAVRLQLTTIDAVADRLGHYRGPRGSCRLAVAVARYTGLPLERARSAAEVRALEVLRTAGRPLPRLNVPVAGEEADLSWSGPRLIIEIDGGPFHRSGCWSWPRRRTSRTDAHSDHSGTFVPAASGPPAPCG